MIINGLTHYDTMKGGEVMQALALWDWEWDLEMNNEELREYHHQKNVEWWQANKGNPGRKQRNREAVQKYTEKRMAEDPEEYRETIRKSKREWAKRNYENLKASMTEEEHEKRKAYMREYVRKRREAARAEKLALADKEKPNG